MTKIYSNTNTQYLKRVIMYTNNEKIPEISTSTKEIYQLFHDPECTKPVMTSAEVEEAFYNGLCYGVFLSTEDGYSSEISAANNCMAMYDKNRNVKFFGITHSMNNTNVKKLYTASDYIEQLRANA